MNLYGWDLLYAVSIEEVNNKLRSDPRFQSFPFNYNSKDPDFGISVNISGIFGPWNIASIGSNRHIELRLPVDSLTIIEEGTSVVVLPGILHATAILELNLAFVDNASGRNVKDLMFNYDDKGNDQASKGIKLLDFESPDLSQENKTLAGTAIVNCLKHHADKLNYVFMSVLLKNEYAQWLSPRHVSFDCVLLGDNRSAYFCIFGSGSESQRQGSTGEVDHSIFSKNDDMYLCISGRLFLQHVIRPAYERKLHTRLEPPYFESDRLEIIGAYLPIYNLCGYRCESARLSGGSIRISGTEIITRLEGDCLVYINNNSGVRLEFGHTSRNTITVNPNDRTVSIVPDPKPDFSYSAQSIGNDFAFGLEWLVKYLKENVYGTEFANALCMNPGIACAFSSDQLSWTNTDFATISTMVFGDNFLVSGKSK
jgi:hypothetical protein